MLRIIPAYLFACSLAFAATEAASPIVIVDINADWCSSCAGGQQTAATVSAQVPGVRTVRLDVSSPEARASSERLARNHGFGHIFEQHRFAPGSYAIATHLQPMQVVPLDASRPVAELTALVAQMAQEPPTPIDVSNYFGGG